MYLMYVDESGDVGLANSPTRYFILCGLVLHENRWRQIMDDLLAYRRDMKKNFKLKINEEIHAAHFFKNKGTASVIQKHQRLEIIRRLADKLSQMPDASLISVAVDKHGKPPDFDVFEHAWKALLQRFENTLSYRNFPGPKNPVDCGILFCDQTDEKKLRGLVRKLRTYNPIPHQPWKGPGYRDMPFKLIIEDPTCRNSSFSFLVQSVDVCAYLLKQHLQPSAYFKSKSAQNYFLRLAPICCKQAAKNHPQGVVLL